MSSCNLRVELPAYSHSFEIQVTTASTIHDVKGEIARVCPGSPNPLGQRLIWRGRFLKDEEKVEDIWTSPDDSRVIHLAVHPSAWASTPPLQNAPSTTAAPSGHSTPRPPVAQYVHAQPTPASPTYSYQSMPPPASSFPAIAYIQYIHNIALGVLSTGAVPQPPQPSMTDIETWRSAAKDLYRSRGWTWPEVLDEPFPSGSPEQGARYEQVTIEGLPYLQLVNPTATPTTAQLHAIKVLTHTFALLSAANDPMFHASPNPYPQHSYATGTNLNQRLHDLGFPGLRLANNPANANPNDPNRNPLAAPGPGAAELRAIPVRALMMPLMMLAFRTLLLLYFFSPSKRPLFGLLLSLWILYEAWNAMRLVLRDGNGRDDAANAAAPNAAPAGAGRPAAPVGGVANANGIDTRPAANTGRSYLQSMLDRLSMLNLSAEDALLESDAPAPPPSVGQKVKMFVLLFFMSLHPAAWDRRRKALRRREGRIRTEANAREAALHEREQANANANADANSESQGQQRTEEQEAAARAREQIVLRHERRPAWLKEYVQRVEFTEWVDDP